MTNLFRDIDINKCFEVMTTRQCANGKWSVVGHDKGGYEVWDGQFDTAAEAMAASIELLRERGEQVLEFDVRDVDIQLD